MAHYEFIANNALNLIDRLEKERNSFVTMKLPTRILKLELRFLSTFLKYTADRCTDQEILQQLFAKVKEVERNLMQNQFLLHPYLWEKLPSIFSDAVSDVLKKIELVKPKMREVQMQVLLRLSGSGSRMSDELVLAFFDAVREDLKELIGYKADLVQPSFREGIIVLKTKLDSLKGLLSFTAERCNNVDRLNQLFTHVQGVADDVAYLAYSCLVNEMDEYMANQLTLQLYDLVQRIDPVNPEVREIYIGVLESSKASESKSNIYEMGETAVVFVDSLLENTLELLYPDSIPVKDQIEMLYEELKCLRYFLQDAEKFTKPGKSNDLLAHVEVMAISAGSVIYSLFKGEINQEMADEMRLALCNLLEKFKLVREIYVNIVRAQIPSLPMTDVLGTLDLLLLNLKELLNDSDDSVILLKDSLQIVQRDVEFLRSFLATITKEHHEHAKLEDLWRRIINVMYEVEYVIDSVVVKDGPLLHHKVWLSTLIEEIKVIKIAISEVQDSDKNIHGLQEHVMTKISSGRLLSQRTAPRTDEEMVGFKDEEEKVVQQLVWGSMQLQIVSVVGMAGLGKTFLAQKLYNNPVIKDCFYVYAWCSISQVYGRKELLSNILSQVEQSTGVMSNKTDEEIAGELYRCLKGQKYLIILDDMWDIGAWEALRRSFPDDNNASRIVFTSRFPELALQAKSDCKIHRLRSFSDSESWELLKKKIFQLESCPSELLEVGQHIAKRCNGLPLAIVVVAGLLARTVKELDRWREVAESLSSFIITDPQRQCMDILDLSYKSLPDYLKPCFLYLGGFLEDKEIPVLKLVQLWIAEGFVRGDKAANLEYVAEGYLMDLIGKSLVIASKERSIGGVKTCILHDLVREFCLMKANEENFLKLIDQGSGDLPTCILSSYPTSYEQRRLFVHCRQGKLNWSKSSGPCSRSLLFFVPWLIDLPTDEGVSSIIHGFKLLRVLDLMCIRLGLTFPKGIESLALLRYLAVSGDFLSLPPSITKLRNLETFIVGSELDNISPYAILNLTKLRHLRIDIFKFSHVSSFDNSFQLDSLQTLSAPSLSYDDDMEVMRRFPNLKKLTCWFQESWDSSRRCNRLPVLGFLNKLESLKVSYSGQLRHPFEFSLPSNIKKLTMSLFRLPWEEISLIGKLPNLEVLKLLDDAFEGQEWNMRDGEFPKLKFLKLEHLNVRKWEASSCCFPPLERLILDGCYYLKEIPSCLEDISTLKMILVRGLNDSLKTSIKQIQEEQREMGNEELKIEIKR